MRVFAFGSLGILLAADVAVDVPDEISGLWDTALERGYVWIVGGVVMLVLLVRIGRTIALNRKTNIGYGKNLKRIARTQVRTLVQANNPVGAAEILYTEGEYSEARELFEQSGSLTRAAACAERMGDIDAAAGLYQRADDHVRAAALYQQSGRVPEAARALARAGKLNKAAALFESIDEFELAAQAYTADGQMIRAANLTWEHGNKKAAAAIYIRAVAGDASLSAELKSEYAKRAALILCEEGNLDGAVQVLVVAGEHRQAARMYSDEGRLEDAGSVLESGGLFEKAATFYNNAGATNRALHALAKDKLQKGDPVSAAKAFAKAGDFERAAELFERSNEPKLAAAAYEQAGNIDAAANVLRQSGQLRDAAAVLARAGKSGEAMRMLAVSGDVESALRLGGKSGEYIVASELAGHAGMADRAHAILVATPADHPQFEAACGRLAQLATAQGDHTAAYRYYQQATHGRSVSDTNIDLFYEMARSAERANDVDRAASLLEQVVAHNPTHKDAGARVHSLIQKSVNASRYKIIEQVARGGMGIVYRAQDTVLDRQVAFKVLSNELQKHKRAVEYFLNEARSAARLLHPNIAAVFDAGMEGGQPYIAMEWVDGQTIRDLVRPGPLKLAQIKHIAISACDALGYAHANNIVHRDVKPGNMLLASDNVLKLVDFGVAKTMSQATENTSAVGTPYYISPEQVNGGSLDGRSDIYSLGVTMFECATGKLPFIHGDLTYHHLHTPPPHASNIEPSVDPELSLIIRRCMAKDPNQRPPTTEALADLLRALR